MTISLPARGFGWGTVRTSGTLAEGVLAARWLGYARRANGDLSIRIPARDRHRRRGSRMQCLPGRGPRGRRRGRRAGFATMRWHPAAHSKPATSNHAR